MNITFTLNPKQMLFHKHCVMVELEDGSREYDVSETLYGGAAGGGKSFAIGASAILHCVEYPGANVGIVRWYLDDLLRTTLEVFLQFVCPQGSELWQELGIVWNKNDRTMTLHNTADKKRGLPPSKITWLGLKSAGGGDTGSINKLLSSQWSRVYGDEAHEISEKIVGVLPSRIRMTRRLKDGSPFHYPLGLKLGSNPAPNWLRRKFIDLNRRQSKPYSKEPGKLFIPAYFQDNIANLPVTYGRTFSHMTPEMARRFRDGDWSAFEGQVWPGGVTDAHLIPEVDLEEAAKLNDLMLIQAVDPGLRDPTASVWALYSYEFDVIIFVQDYEEKKRTVPEHAKSFTSWETFNNFEPDDTTRLIDPEAGKKHLAAAHTGHTVLSLFQDAGLFYVKAQNDTDSKTLTMARRLEYDRERVHPVFMQEGCPGVLFVVGEEGEEDPTSRLREAITAMRWDDGKEKAVWVNENKHLVDCATYITNFVEHKLKAEMPQFEDNYRLRGYEQYAATA